MRKSRWPGPRSNRRPSAFRSRILDTPRWLPIVLCHNVVGNFILPVGSRRFSARRGYKRRISVNSWRWPGAGPRSGSRGSGLAALAGKGAHAKGRCDASTQSEWFANLVSSRPIRCLVIQVAGLIPARATGQGAFMARSGNAGNSGPIERAGQCRRLLPVPMSRWSSSSTARTRDVRQQPDVGVTTNLRSRRVARSAGLAARRRARQEARMRAATSVGTRSATRHPSTRSRRGWPLAGPGAPIAPPGTATCGAVSARHGE